MATSINSNVSLVLSRLLDSYGLDEDTRQGRIDMQKMKQLLWSWQRRCKTNSRSLLLSGSSYESTTIDGLSSDVDVMEINPKCQIIDDIQQWAPGTDVKTYMMDNTGCYPAFVKLYLMAPHYPGPLYSDMVRDILPGHVVEEDGKIFFCNDASTKSRQMCNDMGTELHGPAVTYHEVVDIDFVPVIISKSFPKEAEHWKQRQTNVTKARIGSAIVDQAKYCYVVGVGNKGSPKENIEWRLSFSHIESQLVHAWNNVQYKCYVMMKFIHKDLIKKHVPDNILCSYHYKTILMWMVEEYPAEFFVESNLGECVLAVLKNLAKCVIRKSLPHYFVNGCSLFHNKMGEELSNKTAAVIKIIISTWPFCLCQIEIRKLGSMLRAGLIQNVPLETICEGNLQFRRENTLYFDLVFQKRLVHYFYKLTQFLMTGKQYTEVFKLLRKFIQHSKQMHFCYNMENKQSVTFIVKDTLCRVGLQLLRHSDAMANKAALHYKRLGIGCLQRCINDCCFDTELQIAGYFTMVGNYQLALLLLDNIESRIKDHSVYECPHSFCSQKKIHYFKIRVKIHDNKPSLKEICKYYIAVTVTYTKNNLPHVPRIFVYEMFRTTAVSPPVSPPLRYPETYDWYNHAIIHCPVYLYYLRFLCFHVLQRYAHRQVALDNMAWASKQLEMSLCSHLETNHNILGDCHRTLGNLHTAYREYRKSLLRQKYHNAAIWHLALIVRKKVRNDP